MAIRNADEEAKKVHNARLEAGEVIQMWHPGKGFRFVENTEKAIMWAERRGYEHVEYEDRVIKEPLVKRKPAQASEQPKRGPGRPRKVQSKDGE